MQSIFLHGGWRCGSTYLWNKFRQCPDVTAFYEPFSEKLASYSAAAIARDVPTAWESRHPRLNAPYAMEYLPLITDIGVPLYDESFAVQRHFVACEEHLQERAYIDSLLSHAASRSNYCALGFSRSLGRVGALKRNYPGYHIVLMRDPVQQWLSCRSYRVEFDQPYFELCQFLILALAPRDSLAARAARELGVRTPPAGPFRRQLKFMRSRHRRLDDELSYRVFLTVYILSYLHALPHADLLVDMDRLGKHSTRESVANAIAAHCGLSLDFYDYALPRHDTTGSALDFRRVHDEVLHWLLTEDAKQMAGSGGSPRMATWCLVTDKMQNGLHMARPDASTSLAGHERH